MSANRLKITFNHLHQIKQEYGSTGPYMLSEVHFGIEHGDQRADDAVVTIKQIVGGTVDDPIEVSHPRGWKGPWNHEAFQPVVETYYRSLIGPIGSAIMFSSDSERVQMSNTIIGSTQVATIPVGGDDRGGW